VTGDVVGFKGFLRMTPEVFNELLARIESHVQRSDTIMRDSITPHEMLVVTLRYLATGRATASCAGAIGSFIYLITKFTC
jgi:hypothetical protein